MVEHTNWSLDWSIQHANLYSMVSANAWENKVISVMQKVIEMLSRAQHEKIFICVLFKKIYSSETPFKVAISVSVHNQCICILSCIVILYFCVFSLAYFEHFLPQKAIIASTCDSDRSKH